MMPFLGEDAVMMIYDRHPSLGMHRMSNPSLGITALYSWGCRNKGMQGLGFFISLYNNICRNIDMYITYTPKAKKKAADGIAWGYSNVGWAKF
jgi:hypothetical protein